MSEASEKSKFFTNDQVLRLLVSVFLIGGAWARLEYKMDAAAMEQKAMLREYVISNDKDKQIIGLEMSNLKQQLEVNTMAIKAITEFVKPEPPEIKRNRR